MNNSYLFTAKSRHCWRRSLLATVWQQATSERTNLNIPLFKEDFCSNIQGKQGEKLFGKSWKK